MVFTVVRTYSLRMYIRVKHTASIGRWRYSVFVKYNSILSNKYSTTKLRACQLAALLACLAHDNLTFGEYVNANGSAAETT